MIHCNHDTELNKHAKEEMAADIRTQQRAVLVETNVQRLMQPGGSCYPFEPENFQEALANMGSADAKTLAGKAKLLDYAVINNLEQTAAMQQSMFTAFALCIVREYWLLNASFIAEKETPL